jgi:hypothetical protein
MFVPSRGRGFLIVIVIALSLSLSDWIASIHFHDKDYYAQHGWPKLIAFWIAAGIVQLMLPKKTDEMLGFASQTKENSSVLRERDSLLLIPAKYWPGVLVATGMVFYFVRS